MQAQASQFAPITFAHALARCAPIVLLLGLITTQQLPAQKIYENPAGSRTSAEAVFEPGTVVARVGDQHILQGDLLGEAMLIMGPVIDKLPPEERQKKWAQFESGKEQIVRQLLEGAIQRKLMYVHFQRFFRTKVPEDKRKEALGKINRGVDEAFTKTLEALTGRLAKAKPEEVQELYMQDMHMVRLAMIMIDSGVQREGELDEVLRKYGTTLAYQKQVFMERELGKQARGDKIDRNPVITHDQMLAAYRDNLKDFSSPAKARWEQLSVEFSRTPDRFQAGEAIARMGNAVFFGGGSFASVAKELSQEPNASLGGLHDWVSQGSLRSKPLDRAIFSLPMNEMSDIIEDEDGLHIIRVLERTPAYVSPFTEAQEKLRERLRHESINKQLEQYVADLRRTIPVWTIYDEQQPTK